MQTKGQRYLKKTTFCVLHSDIQLDWLCSWNLSSTKMKLFLAMRQLNLKCAAVLVCHPHWDSSWQWIRICVMWVYTCTAGFWWNSSPVYSSLTAFKCHLLTSHKGIFLELILLLAIFICDSCPLKFQLIIIKQNASSLDFACRRCVAVSPQSSLPSL